VVDAAGAVTQTPQEDEEQRVPKRRRLDRKAGGKAIAGLLGGYGSSGSEGDVKGKGKAPSGLDMLGGYSGSEDEQDGVGVVDEELGDSDTDEVDLDPSALVELVRKARGDDNWTPHTGDDDLVDWGDSDQEE
jgi:hypothetical protein